MSKKLIIIAGAAGLLTFAAAFFGARMLGKSTPPADAAEKAAGEKAEGKQAAAAGETKEEGSKTTANDSLTATEEEAEAKGLTQKKLKNLIYEIREKISAYEAKEKELELREARLQMTQETLNKDIETLNQLKVELAAMTATLKEQKNQLAATRMAINANEKANLTAIATTYDKMDSAGASKIIISMCAKQLETGKTEGGSIDDAVKILYYMNERSRGKLLAEIVSTEPKLAAVLCQRLKKVEEQT